MSSQLTDFFTVYGASPDADVGLIITFIVRQEPPVPANMIIHSKPALDECVWTEEIPVKIIQKTLGR